MEDTQQSDSAESKKSNNNLLLNILLTIVGFAVVTFPSTHNQPTVMSVMLGFFIFGFIITDLLIIIISSANASFFESHKLSKIILDFVVAISFSLILFLYTLSVGIITKDISFLGENILRNIYRVIINYLFFIYVSVLTCILFFGLRPNSITLNQLKEDLKPTTPTFIFLLVLSSLNPINLFMMCYNPIVLFTLSLIVTIVLASTELISSNPCEERPFPSKIIISTCIIVTIVLWLLNA